MSKLSLQSGIGSNPAEMFIDYKSECIDLVVIHEEKQFDFSIEKEEWEQFKEFIEMSMKREESSLNEKQDK